MRLGTKGLIQITLACHQPPPATLCALLGQVRWGCRCVWIRPGSWDRVVGRDQGGGGTQLPAHPSCCWPCWPPQMRARGQEQAVRVARDDTRSQRSVRERSRSQQRHRLLTWLSRQLWLCSCWHLPPPLLSKQQSEYLRDTL